MGSFLRQNVWLLLDLSIIAIVVFGTAQAWSGFLPTTQLTEKLSGPAERQLALQAVQGGAGAAITGASIILGVIGAIAGLSTNLIPKAKMHLRFGAVLCGISLFFGVWISTLTVQYVNVQNLALVPATGIALAVQGYTMLFAMLRLILGTWKVFSGCAPPPGGPNIS